jgi:hypothetical protein
MGYYGLAAVIAVAWDTQPKEKRSMDYFCCRIAVLNSAIAICEVKARGEW